MRAVLLAVVVSLCPALAPGQDQAEIKTRPELGMPGYIIIGAARDTSAGFHWQEGPGPDQLSLTWETGMLTVPRDLVLESYARSDLAVPVAAALTGAGAGGNLDWQDGQYEISEPLMLSDGQVSLLVSKGSLEVVGSRIRYRAPLWDEQDDPADPRASFIMLAGILLLIGVLLRRARRRIRAES